MHQVPGSTAYSNIVFREEDGMMAHLIRHLVD